MKKIKNFFIYNIILSFILIISLYFLSWTWTNYVDDMSVKFLELERRDIQNLKIINIGSSHTAWGIKYPNNLEAYNLASRSQKFYYDYEILKKYYKRFNEGCIVIIPISIQSFYNGYDVEDISKNYISFLNFKVLIGIDRPKYLLGKYFSITQPMTRIIKTLKYVVISLKYGKFNKRYVVYEKDLSFKEKQKAAISTSLSHLGINDSKFRHDKNIGIEQLKEMLKFCEEKKFIPILISTPQTYLYNEQIGKKNYQERIYNNIKEVEKQINKKYPYLDYSHDKRFTNNLKYFSDDDHLNEKGAEYFTKILLDDIKKQGYKF